MLNKLIKNKEEITNLSHSISILEKKVREIVKNDPNISQAELIKKAKK